MYLYIYPQKRVFLEQPTCPQIVTKFLTLCGTQRFIPAFTTVHHLYLSWARSIQSIPRPTYWETILILLFFHLCPHLPNSLVPSCFPNKTLNAPHLSLIKFTWTAQLILLNFFTRKHIYIYICLHENSFRSSMRTDFASLEIETGEYVISDKSLFNVRIILNTQVHWVDRMRSLAWNYLCTLLWKINVIYGYFARVPYLTCKTTFNISETLLQILTCFQFHQL